jgi:hypothetical protein
MEIEQNSESPFLALVDFWAHPLLGRWWLAGIQ